MVNRINRREFTSTLSAGYIRRADISSDLSTLLASHGVDDAALRQIAGDDDVIQGEEWNALFDAIQARAGGERRSGELGVALDLYRAIDRELHRESAPVDAEAPRRAVGLRRQMGNERDPRATMDERPPVVAEVAGVPAAEPAAEPARAVPEPPAIPDGYEDRQRRVGRETVRTHTEISPEDHLRAAQIAALPPAEGRHASVRSYLDAIAARDRIVELRDGGDRTAARAVQRPEGVSAQTWALTEALALRGISTRDVEHYLATGTLPDLLNDQGEVVRTGAERMAELESAAGRGGSWPAVNCFTFLVGMRRSALAAERRAMQEHLATLPEDAPARTEIQAAITASEQLDRDLGRGLQSMYRAATYAREHAGQRAVTDAAGLMREADQIRATDPARARELETRAAALRERGATIAHAEAQYRSSVHAYDASSTYRLAARAQIDTGAALVESMRRSESPLAATVPAELTDAETTASGVPGAGLLLQRAGETSEDGGASHAQLGLETARQGAIASFHQIHVDRSGYGDRIGADGTRPAARTASSEAHRQQYLDARALQARAIMERIGLYGPVSAVSGQDAIDQAQLSAQHAGIMQEMGSSFGTSLATDRQVDAQRTAVEESETTARETRDEAARARTLAGEQAGHSADQRDAAQPWTRTFQTSGEERRDLQAITDADTAERRMALGADAAEARRDVVAGQVSDARAQLRGLEAQQVRDREDADRARRALSAAGILPGSGSTRAAYDRTRALGDESARRSADGLRRAEATLTPEMRGDARTLGDLASTRLDLARYYTGTTEMHAQALGDAGRAHATERLDRAASLIDAADRTRTALPAGSEVRVELASGVVRERSALAMANSDYRPGVSRDQLHAAEAVAVFDLTGTRQAEARAQIGVAAVQSLVRSDARFLEIARTDSHDDTAQDEMYRLAHHQLDRRDMPASGPVADQVRDARALLGRVDHALDQVPAMLERSLTQMENGTDLAAAQTGVMSRAEGSAAGAMMSGLITGSVWLVSLGHLDMREDVASLAEAGGSRMIRQTQGFMVEAGRGADDLIAGYRRARESGETFRYLGAMRVLSLRGSGMTSELHMAARDYLHTRLPGRGELRDWAAFSAQAWNDRGGVPLAQAIRGSVLTYEDSMRAFGDERLAVVTDASAFMLSAANQSLQTTTDGMGWIIGINTVGEVAIGIILTGGLASGGAVAEGANAVNAARTGVQALETAQTVGNLARLARAVAVFRQAHPVLHAAGVTATVGTAMAGASWVGREAFGNSGASRFIDTAGNFIPIGAGQRAVGLAGGARRAAVMGEQGASRLAALRSAVSMTAVREAMSYSRIVAHARFYGPQMLIGGGQVAITSAVVPPAARALGLERNEFAQAMMGVVLGTVMTAGVARTMVAVDRRQQSATAARQLVDAVAAQRETPLAQAQSARLQTAAAREIGTFLADTHGRMPTAEQVAGLRTRLIERLGVDPSTPGGAREVQLIDGAVEAMRVSRAAELGITQAVRERRTTDERATTRERVDALVTPDEISPQHPPTQEMVSRAVDLAAEQLYQARGGEAGGASRALAYRDAAQAVSQTFGGLGRQQLEHGARGPYADALLAAEGWAADRAAAVELAARMSAPRVDGSPPSVGASEVPRLEAFLQTELPRAREMLEGAGSGDMRAHFTEMRQRLIDEVGLSPEGADATLRTLQGDLFDQGVARSIVAAQAASPEATFNNAELAGFARDVARRMGYGREAQDTLARDVVQARPMLEQAGLLRPGGETAAEGVVRTFREQHRELADRLGPIDPDTFVRTFGDQPNVARLEQISRSPELLEMARREPERMRAVMDAPEHLDTVGVARRHGLRAAELYAESPAQLAILLRTDGADATQRALAADPAAARARAGTLLEQYRGRVDAEGAVGLEVLSGAQSGELLARARFPAAPGDATLAPLTPAELAGMGLEPRYAVTIDGVRMGLSEPFELGNGRHGMVAYIEQNGEVHAQILYRSNSQSAWRTSDASREGHFGKGLGEADTALPIDLTVAAHRISSESTQALADPTRVFRGLTVEVTRGAIESGLVELHAPHYYSAEYGRAHASREVGAHGREIPTHHPDLQLPHPSEMRLPPPELVPDFTQPPEASFTFHSEAYAGITGNGELTGHVYRSRDGSLRYLLIEDAQGRVGIVGAEQAGSPLTRWGNRRDFIDLHGMDAPLFEYGLQVAREYGGDATTDYRLNWRYASETPLVQEFYRQRGETPPVALVESALVHPDAAVQGTLGRLPPYEQRAAQAMLHPDVDLGMPAGVQTRARASMEDFVRHNGEDGARLLVRMAESAGPEAVFALFADTPSRQIARQMQRVTPEVLQSWRETPAADRPARVLADFARFRNMPPEPLSAPAARHALTRVRPDTFIRERNTVIEPRVDVAADVQAINEGRAIRRGNEFEVNGRVYGFHDGTLYPIRGDGFHLLDRMSFRALGIYNEHGGDTPAARAALDQNRIPSEAREAALRAWQAGRP